MPQKRVPRKKTKNKPENDLSTLLSFIAEGLVLFNDKGDITLVNPHASLLLDYTSGELIGKNIDDVIEIYVDNKKIRGNQKIGHTVLVEGKPFQIPSGKTVYFKTRSGRTFPVFVSAKAIPFGSRKGGVLVFRDITTQKELEKYKINTAKKLSTITPVLQKTATGDFSATVSLPKKEDEFTELFVGIRLMIDDLKEIEKERAQSEKDKIKALEEKRKLTENYSKQLEVEVKEKVRELHQITLHNETIIENLTSGLVEYDHGFGIVKMNKAAEQILGVDRRSVIGRKIKPEDVNKLTLKALTEITYPALAENVRRMKLQSIRADADIHEIVINNPNEKILQVITAPIIGPFAGGREGLVKVIRDVTREKLISKSKSEFISIAAHQLRTPLSGIKWATHLVMTGDLGRLNKEQEKLLRSAYNTNEKMVTLVNDLLNVARIEEGRFGYEFKAIDIKELVSQVLLTVKVVADKKNILLELTSSLPIGTKVVIDEEKMSLALQNLIDNAVKYTPENGNIKINLSIADDYLTIAISDSGIGIPKNQISRLFTKFFRAENVSHMDVTGSGLGLFIVRNIITRHGGIIDVQSEELKGTTFSVRLPLDERKIPVSETTGVEYY